MAAEVRSKAIQNALQRHIASITSPYRCLIINEGISEKFRNHYQKLFTEKPGLRCAHFNTYLADFPRLALQLGVRGR